MEAPTDARGTGGVGDTQSERVGRNVVDNFETAVERAGKDKGYIVAFSFTKGAREEVARAPMADVTDLPITLAQAAKDRPTVEELIASETA